MPKIKFTRRGPRTYYAETKHCQIFVFGSRPKAGARSRVLTHSTTGLTKTTKGESTLADVYYLIAFYRDSINQIRIPLFRREIDALHD